jgi:hypothetical protein
MIEEDSSNEVTLMDSRIASGWELAARGITI